MSMIGNLLRVTDDQLEAYLKDSASLTKRIYNEEGLEDDCLVDIEKAWSGILYLLTGQELEELDHPLAKIFFSGQVIDESQDLGYGPAHYLTSSQVKELNKEISLISVSDLKAKFESDQMTELDIYPNIWDEGDEAFEYLSEYFIVLQKVYAEAAKNGEAMITYLS